MRVGFCVILVFGAQPGRCRRGESGRVGWAGFGSLGPCTAAGGSASCTGTQLDFVLCEMSNLEFPVGHIDLKFEDDDDGVSRYGPDVLHSMGYRGSASPCPKHVSRYQGKGHHVVGAIKAANSSGPGNVELRGWREKGGHQQGGLPLTRKADARLPRAETARDRCAVNSMERLIEFW
jgi:hypothetical protein